ncbi:hypothetical protein WA026_017642 [Henosepilachna vigintioctopunctata]|uniref:U3 small nucleolar ribonucleoprotein protein MPP10 n=1 Tax=Henosepilachna vigintioctopunctata TaxID=420089 RepID=A0AAW1UZW3_9CUCU
MGVGNEALSFLGNLILSLKESNYVFSEPSSNIKQNLKVLYDHCKVKDITSSTSNTLPKLLIDNFDNEQIWQQIDLQNDFILKDIDIKVKNTSEGKNDLSFCNIEDSILEIDDEESSGDGSEIPEELELLNESSDDPEGMEVDQDSEQDDDEDKLKVPHNSVKKSVVDDNFFKLHEMNEFLDAEEKKLNSDSGTQQELLDSDEEESIDLFAEDYEDSGDEEARLVKYKDFFSSTEEKKPKKNKYLEEFSDEDDFNNEQSNFELRQNRLKLKIDEIESKAISEKPWQLQGEIKADSRPQNSLLEEVVEFERTSRPAPIITEKTTLQLEDIIKQRIKDKTFDSVVRKVKVVDTPQEFRKQLVLDQEKSKASLAQIYEKEYLDQQAALDPTNAEKEEVEPELHKTIRTQMSSLFHELDALSNFHFTPKPAIPELKIISNIPAINMEEVAPVAISDAALLAPEEVKKKPKVEILGKTERTKTDKNRERRKKKLKQKYHASLKAKSGKEGKSAKQKDAKLLEKVSKQMNTKKMDQTGQKGIKSSTAFFKQLQDQIHSQLHSNGSSEKKKKTIYNAKKMKL